MYNLSSRKMSPALPDLKYKKYESGSVRFQYKIHNLNIRNMLNNGIDRYINLSMKM